MWVGTQKRWVLVSLASFLAFGASGCSCDDSGGAQFSAVGPDSGTGGAISNGGSSGGRSNTGASTGSGGGVVGTAGGSGGLVNTGGSGGVSPDAGAGGAAQGGTGGNAGTGGSATGGADAGTGGTGGSSSGGNSGAGGSIGNGGAGGSLEGGAGTPNCPAARLDCAGVCDGPGVSTSAGCCVSGAVDCNGQCDGHAVSTAAGCCLSGRVDCNGVCDGPGTSLNGTCCPSGTVDCAGVCDGPGVLRGLECCATGVCPAASCDDAYQNGNESDVGCGGGACPGCPPGALCRDDSDCTFHTDCIGGTCVARTIGSPLQQYVNLDVLNIARNPIDGTVYASIGPGSTAFPNSVVAFAPYGATPAWSTVTGEGTGPLAVSDDGATLYAGVQSAQASVLRMNIGTHAVVSSFPMGIDLNYGPVMPVELDVRPGDPDTVAVTGDWFSTTASPGIHVFTNGVDHDSSTDLTQWQNNALASTRSVTTTVFASPDTLYAYDGATSSFTLATVHFDDTTGLAIVKEPPAAVQGFRTGLVYAGGKLFANTGEVLDPTGPTLLGMLGGSAASSVAVSPSGKRAYFVWPNFDTYGWEVHCYDVATFRWTGGFAIDKSLVDIAKFGTVGEVEVWGTKGLVVQFLDVSLNGAIFSPDALDAPGCSPDGDAPRMPPRIDGDDGVVGAGVALDVAANAIAEDPATGGVYLAVNSGDLRLPNYVAYVPPDAVRVAWSTAAGSDPAVLGPTDDGKAVWVGLAGAAAIQSVDTALHHATESFVLPLDALDGQEFPSFLRAVPNELHSVAVAGYYRSTTRVPLIRIFDSGVDRDAWKNRTHVEELLSGLDLFDMEFQGNSMFARDNNTFGTFDVSAQGLQSRASYSGVASSGGVLRAIGNELIAGTALVDIPSVYRLGQVQYRIETASTDGARGYALDDGYDFHCYDLATFTETGKVNLKPSQFAANPAGIARWGASGLAVNTGTGAVLFFKDLLDTTSGCAPRSTGTLPPGSSIQPDNRSTDGKILEYAIDANDLAESPSDGTVYATVPSRDARFPNQLVAFNPGATSLSWAVRVGSNPNALAVSDDGAVVYVGLDGAGRIAKVDTTTRQSGTPFPIGLIDGETPQLLDLDVSPASNDTFVAVAQPITLAYANGSTGPLLFRDGQRVFPNPLVTDQYGTWLSTTRVEFTDANTIFGHGQALFKVSVSGDTLTKVWSNETMVTSLLSGVMSSDGSRLFYSGYLVDPAGPTLIGQVINSGGSQNQTGIPVMTNDGQRIIGITNQGVDPGTLMSIRCFDGQTLAQIGSTYSFATPTYSNIAFAFRIVPWGTTGAAVLTSVKTLLFMPTVLKDIGCK